MTLDSNTNWDDVARRFPHSKPLRWPSHYTRQSYLTAIQRALAHVDPGIAKVDLLKTDLWEEGIERGIDVLGQFEGDERYRLHGVDISAVACSLARQKTGGLHVIQGDIRSLPFADASFHALFDLSTLDHVPFHEAKEAVAEYGRVLRSGGVLLLAFWCDTAVLRLLLKLGGVRHRLLAIGGNQYYFPAKAVRGWLQGDFDVIEEYSIGSVLSIGFLIGVSEKALLLVDRLLPRWLAGLVLRAEYSGTSRWLLSGFAGLRAIIAMKK